MPDEEKHFVLIAEDDPDDRFLLEQGILNSDFKFTVTYRFVCTGPETLKYLENQQNPIRIVKKPTIIPRIPPPISDLRIRSFVLFVTEYTGSRNLMLSPGMNACARRHRSGSSEGEFRMKKAVGAICKGSHSRIQRKTHGSLRIPVHIFHSEVSLNFARSGGSSAGGIYPRRRSIFRLFFPCLFFENVMVL